MTTPTPSPKPPRKMLQPRKDRIRWRAEIAEAQLAFHRTPRWWRLWRRIYARVVETDPVTAQAMTAMHQESLDV